MAVLSGLYNFLTQNSAAAVVQALLTPAPQNQVHFSLAPKQPVRPFLVIHLLDGPPAEATLTGSSALIDAEFQFDSYADDQLTARALSQAVRDALKNLEGSLPDGTVVNFYQVVVDLDERYELGGSVGYIFRSLVRIRAFYTEPGSS